MKSISIIIPFHKGLCFLGDLFESILDQNLEEEDYEVICLGDAPEEGIVARIEEYEKRGLPVRYVQWIENRGTGFSRNKGILMAEGRYVYFIDSDDYLLSGCLNRLLSCAEEYSADIVFGQIKPTFFKRESFVSDSEVEYVDTDRKGTDADFAKIFASEVTVLNALIRKEILIEKGLRFNEDVSFYSDMSFVMRLLSVTSQYYLAHDACYAKREHNDPVHLPQLSQLAKKDPKKMLYDMTAVYEESYPVCEGQPKRKNLISYILCKCVLSTLDAGLCIKRDDFKNLPGIVKNAYKNVQSRFGGFSKALLICVSHGNYRLARLFAMLIVIQRKKSGRFGNRIQWYRFFDKLIFSHMKRRDDWIVFESFFGRGYNDSPKYIYEYMLDEYKDKYTYIWVFNEPGKKVCGSPKYVIYNSLRHVYYARRARYHVCNVRQPGWFVKSNDMVFLETWHGTPLKRLVFDMDDVHSASRDHKVSFYRDSRKWDYLLSANRFSTDIFEHAFDLDRDIIVETGYPRNDILKSDKAEEIGREVKRELGIPEGKKVLLYAPTWRDNEYYGSGDYKFRLVLDFDMLRERIGDEWTVILRTHYYVADRLDLSAYEGFVYNASSYEDISRLYLAADVCMTDYSSVFFDYACLKRPILFFVYDFEAYKNELRGMYLDMETELPGPLLYTNEDVIEAIIGLDKICEKYHDRYEEFYQRFCSLEDGNASERAAKLLLRRRVTD